jgi:hypothetical protein
MTRSLTSRRSRAGTRRRPPFTVSAVIAVLLAAILSVPLTLGATAANATNSTGSWLAAQVSSTGSVIDPYGTEPSVDWAVNVALALLADGEQADALDRAVVFIEANTETYVTSGTSDEAGHLSWLILLAMFTDRDPHSFGPRSVDLVSRLQSRFEIAEPGLFGVVDDFTPVTNQALAIIALNATRTDVPAGALEWLRAQQCTLPTEQAGGWQGYRSEVTPGVLAACEPTTSAEYNRADAASTSFALQALAAVGRVDDPAIVLGLEWFHRLQSAASPARGGFGQYIGDTSDPNSTALVIQAIRATDDSVGAGWELGGGDPASSITSWVIDSGPDAGALASPYSDGAADLYATYQGLWGIKQRPLPTLLAVPVLLESPEEAPQVGNPPTLVAPSFTG